MLQRHRPAGKHPTDQETAAAGTQETVTTGAVATTARVAQPRLAPARATPAGLEFSQALGGSSSGSGARCTSAIAGPSDLLMFEATKPHLPDPEINGGEPVLDDPRTLRSHAEIERTSSATGRKGEEASAATGQAVGGSMTPCAGLRATVSPPGLNSNWPYSRLILAGVKTIDTLPYALGHRKRAFFAGRELASLVERL